MPADGGETGRRQVTKWTVPIYCMKE